MGEIDARPVRRAVGSFNHPRGQIAPRVPRVARLLTMLADRIQVETLVSLAHGGVSTTRSLGQGRRLMGVERRALRSRLP
jgi:hypothetical protein